MTTTPVSSTVETVHVPLGARAYDVLIGEEVLQTAGAWIAPLLGAKKRVCVLTDENVAARHLDTLRAGLAKSGVDMAALALPAGETTKCWAELSRSVEWLLSQKVERGDVVVAFGGGVIGDLGGFAAAILRRGRAVRSNPNEPTGAGRQLGGWQDRHQRAARKEPDRCFSPTLFGPCRCVASQHPDDARLPFGLRGGRQIRATGRRGLFCLAGRERRGGRCG